MADGEAVDRIAIPQQGAGCRFPGEYLHDLASRPLGSGMVRHVEVENPPSVVRQDEDAKQHLEPDGRTVKKSIETKAPMWFLRNVRQLWEGGLRCSGM